MPKPPAFNYARDARGRWVINVPAAMTSTGKRERRFFKSRDAAKTAAEELRARHRDHGASAATIRPALAEDATTAESLLAPWGASLTDAARFFAAAREREAASRPADDAVTQWLAEGAEEWRQRTLQGYRRVGRMLAEKMGKRALASLSADEIREAIMPPGTPTTAAAVNYRTAKAFWRWAAKRGWCDADTFGEIEAPRNRRDNEIEILTPSQAALLLDTAAEHFPATVPMFAIQLFAGIRPEEATRLRAEHVTGEGIELPASVTKKGRRRYVGMTPTLRAWLDAFPFDACPGWKRKYDAVRCLAGWRVKAARELVPTPPADFESREPWPQNCLRHSHATYAVAAGAPLEQLLFEFGHAGNPTILRQHYVGRSSKKQALQFFAIRPGGEHAEAQLSTVQSA